MAEPTVIDTNCLKYFQNERVTEQLGTYTAMIEKARAKGCLAIDDEGQAMQEYYDCCKPSLVGLNLTDWIADEIVNRFIVMFPFDRRAEKELKSLGVPKKDLKWPAIAKGSNADLIVTDDIDLFEPSAKNYASSKKEKIKNSGGCVSKYLRKKHGILVSTAKKFVE